MNNIRKKKILNKSNIKKIKIYENYINEIDENKEDNIESNINII